MNQLEISLRNMPNIIATCIVLHNLCIVINESIEEEWIIEAKNKLATRVIELRKKITGLAKVNKKIMTRDDTLIPEEVNNVQNNLFLLREYEKINDLLNDVTIIYILLIKSLW
jgi:hypothetical protein